MAALYFHIPFCKTRCVYCDFFSSTDQGKKEEYISALCRELEERKNYLQGETIETIYFGGGTPSLLSAKDFERIFETCSTVGIPLHPVSEITLEANPDDLNEEYLDSLKHLPFNRISIGIQSFNDKELVFLNRRHNAQSAIRAVELCQKKGLQNISIDLIYGLPNQTLANWEATIRQAIALNIPHISAYHLIYEEATPLHRFIQEKQIQAINEETSVRMFEILIDKLASAGFEHYEISNFAKKGFHSRHNSSYWNGTPYLGIGASAHSFDGKSRQWNVSGLNYLVQTPEIEILSPKDQFNDFILTRLRTMQGIDLEELSRIFGEKQKNDCLRKAQKHLNNKCLEIDKHFLRLSCKGIFVSDGIMCDLMH